ncbi:MAG: hypothetical protein J1E98_06405 [Lachnospiraceae bacterium]|nr:hypothetical protein [Lachnospiraceae bacterium]
MKKKLAMISVSVLILCVCVFTTGIPALANSEINSSGAVILEDNEVEFYSKDIEELDARVEELSEDLSDEFYSSYVPGQDKLLKNKLNSKGIVNYDHGKVIFDASDLVKLADGIDSLNVGYKYEAVNALNKIGTYFKTDGTITYEQTGTILPENVSELTFSDICMGIIKSQSVDHLADQGILPAITDNLSEGSAAWVDGKLIIGNGNDNKNSYNQGYDDGHAKGYEEGEAANPRVECYFLGHSKTSTIDGKMFYNVAPLVPEIDCTQLTAENFIVCPYMVNSGKSSTSKYTSIASNVTVFCNISESELSSGIDYNPETGYLYVAKPAITASGGLSGVSGYTRTATTYADVNVYLVTGEITDRSSTGGDFVIQ